MFDRFLLEFLENWNTKLRRKPLVLRGARQTGKSTLIRLFARKHNLRLNEINLERNLFLDEIFKSLNMEMIINELEAVTGSNLQEDSSILFLDEIQATPHALQALRYFYEDIPEMRVISAGSLLEFVLSDHSFSMPVGRIEYLHLGPMTFKEFLHVLQPDLLQYIEKFNFSKTIPCSAHNQLEEKFKLYCLIGGMPEAVLAYEQTGSLVQVADVQKSIADTYFDDFSKYGRQVDTLLMQQLFHFIPRALGTKVKYSNIAREKKARDVKKIIDLLINARVCHKVYHTHGDGVPLFAGIKQNIYKLIFMDIGIVNYICGNNYSDLKTMLTSKSINQGGLAEQFAGQHLLSLINQAPILFYWLRQGKSSNAEVDYIISHGSRVYPVEVKSGKSGSLKSLQQFVLEKKIDTAVRFDLNPPSVQDATCLAATGRGSKRINYKLISLPLYMVEEIFRVIDILENE